MTTTNKIETDVAFLSAPTLLTSKMQDNLFDQLPTDMIYYEIFPYLDYYSRVTANLLLPKKDRLGVPLKKLVVKQFAMKLGSSRLKSMMNKQSLTTSPISRNRLMLKIWRTFPNFPELFQHNAKFREITMVKIAEFTDPSLLHSNVSRYTFMTLQVLCKNLLVLLETSFPYLHEISLPSENWSAVY